LSRADCFQLRGPDVSQVAIIFLQEESSFAGKLSFSSERAEQGRAFQTLARSVVATRIPESQGAGPTGSSSDVEKKSRVEKKNHGTWTGSGYPSGRRGLGQRQNKKSEKRTKGKTGAAGTRPGFLGL